MGSLSTARHTLTPGIYVPTLTFFDPETEELDTSSISKHAQHLARCGVAGIVTNGSNGEAVHLSRAERMTVTLTTRTALSSIGYAHIPIVVGASAASVKETIGLCVDAQEAGGDAVLLLASPSYYAWAASREALRAYFLEVAEKSPLPVLIYNYPAAAGGIDLDSDLLAELCAHANVVGVKFTCGSTGKMARVARAVGLQNEISQNTPKQPVRLFAGMADFIVPALSVGGAGTIAGGANIFPRACVRVFDLMQAGKVEEARIAQLELAEADWALTKVAIPGFKAVLQRWHGYGGVPRRPMLPLGKERVDALYDEISDMIRVENELPMKG